MQKANPAVALIDYGMGNLRSVTRALEYSGAEVTLVNNPKDIKSATHLVFPGQGAIVDAMRELKRTGFDSFLKDWIAADRPFMGICLGLQMLFDYSEEGDTPGLGVFSGKVRRFKDSIDYKVPHMGWNTISLNRENIGEYAENISSEGDYFYFVHSYYVTADDKSLIWSKTIYNTEFVSGIRKGNIFAVQFHPEKSQKKGLQIYHNFLFNSLKG